MNPVRPVENIYAALWKSAATEVVARSTGQPGPAAGIDAEHPLLAATDHYVAAVSNGQTLDPPSDGAPNDDLEVAAYLAQLHHRLAHARMLDDPGLKAQLDEQREQFRFGNPLWEQMSIQYFEYYWQYPYHLGGQPLYRSWTDPAAGRGDPNYSVIEWRLPANARVALVGDIGTGTDVAVAVLVAALSFRPDAILHVGDVYYSGTQFEFEHRFAGMFESVFADQGFRVPVFTVPGNHEYFTGGVALLDCLSSGRLAVTPDQRQAASYFCLRSADDGWQFLGLDTGFHGHTFSVPLAAQKDTLRILHAQHPEVPLDPSAPSPSSGAGSTSLADLPVQAPQDADETVFVRDDEVQWHRHKIEGFGGRTILLSHHPLYSAAIPCGPAQRTIPGPNNQPIPDPTDLNRRGVDLKLWQQFGPYFGERIAAWFWGHEHNLGIFQDGYRPPDWPADLGDDAGVFRTLPKGRCIGHSAIPVQEKENPYAQNNPVPLEDDSLRLGLTDGWYNRGFEILELAGAGNPARVRYYQIVSADPTPLLIYEETVE